MSAGSGVRLALVIVKTPTAWRWHRIDKDLAGIQILTESGDFATRQPAEAAARAAYPAITDVEIHAVRDTGTAYEDSLPSWHLQGGKAPWWLQTSMKGR